MTDSHIKISKFLSYVLRHDPGSIGLVMQEDGWVSVDELLICAKKSGKALNRDFLLKIVALSTKQRFEISADGLMIRATHGHSVRIAIDQTPEPPPGILYHGTTQRYLAAIKNQGLYPGKRLFVHLSEDKDMALAVGARHGPPLILEIAAGVMHAAGYTFHHSKSGVWLTKHVPLEFIKKAGD